MQALARNFIPAADQVDRLQSSADEDAKFFQSFANTGHTRDVGVRGLGRQGTYAITASGKMLASVNSPEAQHVVEMMEAALRKWESLPASEKAEQPALPALTLSRSHALTLSRFPHNGLVLWVTCRDLPREDIREEWRSAWGMDHAWLRKEEARKFAPESLKPGATHSVPRELVERLARFHLVDSARARESLAYRKNSVRRAELTAKITKVEGSRVHIRYAGATRTEEKTDLFPDTPAAQNRGYDAKLLGRAVFNSATERFESFELLAIGDRRGATACNMRIQDNDLGPAPMAVLLTLADDSPVHRVPPSFLSQYGW